MRRSIELHDGIAAEEAALHHPGGEARNGRLPRPQSAEGKAIPGHVVHPRLNHLAVDVLHAGRPARVLEHKAHEVVQVPAVGPDTSFLFAALLALVSTELLHKLDEGLRHDAGPPAQATATFSPRRSIRSH